MSARKTHAEQRERWRRADIRVHAARMFLDALRCYCAGWTATAKSFLRVAQCELGHLSNTQRSEPRRGLTRAVWFSLPRRLRK